MKVFKRICVRDETFVDGEKSITLKRGQEYTTSAEHGDGTVTVFTTYWFRAPVDLLIAPVPL